MDQSEKFTPRNFTLSEQPRVSFLLSLGVSFAGSGDACEYGCEYKGHAFMSFSDLGYDMDTGMQFRTVWMRRSAFLN